MTDAPGYLRMLENGTLRDRVSALMEHLVDCRLCPRKCGVNRNEGERGFCGAGFVLELSSSCVHRGEEPVLTGGVGVGNFFLGRCNLKCVFCQNHSISQPEEPVPESWRTKADDLAQKMLDFQSRGCPTVGFVSPTHYVPQIFQAVAIAAARGFHTPIIYNSGGYESPEVLELLHGMVDIYLPDFKYWDPSLGLRYSMAPDYPEVARRAVVQMYRQVGNLATNEDGVAFRGTIIRLLVLPGGLSGTKEILRFIAGEIGTDVYISLMSQYYPMHRAGEFPELSRTIDEREYSEVVETLETLGFSSGWTQDPVSSPENYLPGKDFRIRYDL